MRHLILAAAAIGCLVAGPVLAQGVAVDKPWTRAASAGGMVGVYGKLCNTAAQPVTVTGADSDVAGTVQLHRDVRDTTGTVRMQPRQNGFDLPAGGCVVLQPGAGHIMLMRLRTPLREGASVPLTLHVHGAPDVSVTVPVARLSATAAP